MNCTIYPCIRTYRAQIRNGSSFKTLLRTTEYNIDDDDFNRNNGSMVDIDCLPEEYRNLLSTYDRANRTSTSTFIGQNQTSIEKLLSMNGISGNDTRVSLTYVFHRAPPSLHLHFSGCVPTFLTEQSLIQKASRSVQPTVFGREWMASQKDLLFK